jgi:hypothetical protein
MSDLRLKVIPQFPSRVVGRVGIDVVKENGVYSLDLDVTEFPVLPNVPPDPNLYVLAYNIVTKQFVLVPK